MSGNQTVLVQFQPVGKRTAVPHGTSLIEAARSAGIALTASCGGEGSCGQCQVTVISGLVSSPTDSEARLLKRAFNGAGIPEGRRLACAANALGDVTVAIPKGSLLTGQRLHTDGASGDIPVNPLVTALHLEVPPPGLEDTRSDLTRIIAAACQQQDLTELHACPEVIRSIPKRARQQNWRMSMFVREKEIIGIGPYDARPLGLAVDLGTTKIAAVLVDLHSGEILASTGRPNPQISYGEDVISRLNYIYRHPEGDITLASSIQETLDGMLGDLVEQAGVDREQVVDACVVGNTAMVHLLLRLPIRQLATAPYVSAVSDALDVRADEIGLRAARGAYAHIPACIGGFVGADHLAMMLACSLDRTDTLAIGIDIGTNTEIAIHKPGESFLTSVSCASGPAFEGAHISEGMRAASGAIERVRILPGGPQLETVNGGMPVGLCGSGIIDAAAELYRCGIINRQGRFQRGDPHVQVGEEGPVFLLVPAGQSGTGRDIAISQKDIDQVQLAKGAIHAGLKILMESTASAAEAVEEVFIAGAFGSYLNIEHAVAMGLFPVMPNARYHQVGNAALTGAKWILISQQARQRARQIQSQVRYLELSTYAGFRRAFALGMLFPDQANRHPGS